MFSSTHRHNITKHGFTLVELMIVIVIIAILATITLVTYESSKDRAKQTVTLNAFDQYAQMLSSYKTANGYYPPTQIVGLDGSVTTNLGNSAAGYVCLGVNGPADSPFASNQCFFSSTPGLTTYENSTIDTQLKTISPNLQVSVGKPVLSSDKSTGIRGILYTSQRNATGSSNGATLIMSPSVGKDCGRGTYYDAGTSSFGSVIPIPACILTLP